MRVLLKRLLKMIAGYGAVQWAGPFLSLLFTKIVTAYAEPADYGLAGKMSALVTSVAAIGMYTIPQALNSHYHDKHDKKDDATWQYEIGGGAMLCAMAFSVLAVAPFWAFSGDISRVGLGVTGHESMLRIASLYIISLVLSQLLIVVAQTALRVRLGMALTLTAILTSVAGNVVFIVYLRLGALGILLVPIVSGFAIALVALIAGRDLLGKPSMESIKKVVRAGVLLLPVAISMWVLNSSDRFFLAHNVSDTEIGHYEIAYKIASLLGVFMGPIYTAVTPLALSIQHQAQAKEHFVILARYLVAISLLAGLALGLFATEILIVLTRTAYLPAATYVGVLCYAQIFVTFGNMLVVNELVNKRLWQMGVAQLIGAGVNLALNAILIPMYGIWGASIATSVGWGVPTAILYLESRRRRALPYPMRIFLMALVAHMVILVVGLLLPPMWFPLRVSIKVVLLGGMIAVLVGLGVITTTEVYRGWMAVRRRVVVA